MSVTAQDKQDALLKIADIAKAYGLSASDISTALADAPALKAKKSTGIVGRMFGYVGGIFILCGLGTYIATIWPQIGALGHVLVTFGPGACLFIAAISCADDERFTRAATPLFLIAALLEASGLGVLLHEFSRGGDPEYGALFISFTMAVQQGFIFRAKDRTVLAFTTIFFALSFFGLMFDLLHVPPNLNGIVMGVSLLCIGWSLCNSRHRAVSPLANIFGSLFLLSASYNVLLHTPIEALFLGICCGIGYLSTIVRSRMLLAIGTLAMVGYICDFTERFFANSLNWPLMLVFMGFVFIGLGAAAVKVSKKYIRLG